VRWFIRNGNKDKIKAAVCKHIDSLENDAQIDIVDIVTHRTIEQNKLQREWMNQLASQGDMSAEEYRARTKLHVGVPILRAENEEFMKRYDEVIRPMDYETKIKLMSVPFDFPVTRLMTKKQKKQYLDAMHRYWSEQGFILTVKEQ